MKIKLSPLHRYQLGVIFLFAFSFFLFIPYLKLLELYNLKGSDWSWYFFIIWVALYTTYCLILRSKTKKGDRGNPLKRPLFHWAILGIAIIYLNVIKPTNLKIFYPGLNLAFIVFSLFLADTYWDFKKTRLFTKK